jgi:hypothetical protein
MYYENYRRPSLFRESRQEAIVVRAVPANQSAAIVKQNIGMMTGGVNFKFTPQTFTVSNFLYKPPSRDRGFRYKCLVFRRIDLHPA